MQVKPIEILQKYWGYEAFRPLQEEIINSVLSGKDTLALMPTGGGKSITFQVPALMQEGLCLVITPLVALMKDQVNNLVGKGIKAEALYTGMTFGEMKQKMNKCLYAEVKFLYVSPERLESSLFQDYLPQLPLSLIAVDEAHCISQWGYDFRPAYLNIANIRTALPDIPILAVTATATKKVVADIQNKLLFEGKNVFQKSFTRNNLHYFVINTEDKFKYIYRIFNKTQGSGIVYVRSRKKTKQIAEQLIDNGINATFFHAGLDDTIKNKRQEDWTVGKTKIMVATNAFGMGIDKPDVRAVVHIDLPDSLEAYFQEAGRAGRDGKEAYAVMLYHKSDEIELKKRINQKFPKRTKIRQTYTALCNFLQIPEGGGIEQSFSFNMSKFVATFKLGVIHTHNSLNILRSEGVIDFLEEISIPSQVLFRMRRDNLYNYQTQNPLIEDFIKGLLRMYSGLFTDYTRINEYKIAEKIGLTVEQVKTFLIELAREQVIFYIPQKKSPYVAFPDGRIPANNILLNKDVYSDRKTLYEKKINAVLHYVTSQTRCRAQMLLTYFNDFSGTDCGHCDFCLKKDHGTSSLKEMEIVKKKITEFLSETPQSITTLETNFEDTEMLHSTLKWMFDNNKIIRKPNNFIALCLSSS